MTFKNKNIRKLFSCMVFLFGLILLSNSLFAQKKKYQNLPKRDHNVVNFGFALGINKTDFVLDPAPNFRKLDTLFNIKVQPGSGFNLGIMSEWRFNEFLGVRFAPNLSFTQRNIIYTFDTSAVKSDQTKFTSTKIIESTFLEFPFDIKYKSVRINNYRMYLVAGGKYSIDMASQKKTDLNNANPYKSLLKIDKKDYGYYFGFGIDCYLAFFRFSPEIKVYHGINNLIVQDGRIYSSAIDKLKTKTFVLSFVFE